MQQLEAPYSAWKTEGLTYVRFVTTQRTVLTVRTSNHPLAYMSLGIKIQSYECLLSARASFLFLVLLFDDKPKRNLEE